MYGVINFNLIDTTPGAATAFAPPLGFDGNYVAFILDRVKLDPGVRQHVACIALRFRAGRTPPEFTGEFAAPAEQLARRILRKLLAKEQRIATDAQ